MPGPRPKRAFCRLLSLRALLPLLGSLALLFGCAHPRFMVPGLNLPPGVNGYSFADCDGSSGVYDSKFGQVRRVIMLGFSCPQGWDSAVKHFDTCLAEAGFTIAEDGLERAGYRLDLQRPVPIGTMVRSYVDTRRHRAVLLVNNAGIQLATAAFNPQAPIPASRLVSSGEFALSVIQYR